jgi:hypothetical protein
MIETNRLLLRAWRNSDKPRFAQITNTPHMTEHLGGDHQVTGMNLSIDGKAAKQASERLSGQPIVLTWMIGRLSPNVS